MKWQKEIKAETMRDIEKFFNEIDVAKKSLYDANAYLRNNGAKIVDTEIYEGQIIINFIPSPEMIASEEVIEQTIGKLESFGGVMAVIEEDYDSDPMSGLIWINIPE